MRAILVSVMLIVSTIVSATAPPKQNTPSKQSGELSVQGLYLLGDVKEFINPQADQALSVTLLQKGGEEGIVFEDDVLRSLALREVESFVVLEETVTDVATRQKLRHLTVLGVAKIGDKEEVRYEKHLFYPAGDRSFIIKKDAAPPPTKPSRPVGGRAIV